MSASSESASARALVEAKKNRSQQVKNVSFAPRVVVVSAPKEERAKTVSPSIDKMKANPKITRLRGNEVKLF